jgi:hypothetical protein
VALQLIPVVIGWLTISPKCDAYRIRNAIEEVNNIAYIAGKDGISHRASSSESGVGPRRAISLERTSATLLHDEAYSPPIFNYAPSAQWIE